MSAYYNEIDPFAAAWLRELIKAGHIAPGFVDERSVEDVKPIELAGYTQCHFFAGIGGWSLALRLAGIPDDYPIWTGSCPCQPFSAAGKGAGFDDSRHLWPSFAWLIAQCRPATVFGEQVASKATGDWFDLVHADLEAMGYAFGLIPFPAAGIGAPHIRDRAYWVGHSIRPCKFCGYEFDHGSLGKYGCPNCEGDGLEYPPGNGWEPRGAEPGGRSIAGGCGQGGMADTEFRFSAKHEGQRHRPGNTQAAGAPGRFERFGALPDTRPAGPTNGHWGDADWLLCRDGKWRPVEPGTFPLANGVSNRVGKLRGYGNAIVPPQAAEFVMALMESA